MLGMRVVDVVGFMAAAMTLVTFAQTSMVLMRCAAVGSNVGFILYGEIGSFMPILCLHAILLPLNLMRLRQAFVLAEPARRTTAPDAFSICAPSETERRLAGHACDQHRPRSPGPSGQDAPASPSPPPPKSPRRLTGLASPRADWSGLMAWIRERRPGARGARRASCEPVPAASCDLITEGRQATLRVDTSPPVPEAGLPGSAQAAPGPSRGDAPKRLIAVLSDGTMTSELASFYCRLGFDDRRRRFRGGVSDASIRSYLAGIDVRRCFAVGMSQGGGLRAVVEVHALDDAFETAELTACCGPLPDSLDVLAHLVQIAAFQAAGRRCRRLVVEVGDCTPDLMEILRDVGERGPGGLILFDVDDLHDRA